MAGQFAAICFHNFTPGNGYRVFGAVDEAEPLKKVKVIADYLYSKNVKFHINLIPEYVNPEHPEQDITILDTSSSYIQELINTLNYMENKGGVIGIEGVTHQYDNGITAEWAEFHTNILASDDPENPPDDILYDTDKMELAASIINLTELEMSYWLEPWYSAFPPFFKQEEVFPRYISLLYQYDSLNSSIPNEDQRKVMYHDVDYGTGRGVVYLNEPLYYIEPWLPPDHNTVLTVPYILYNAQNYGPNDIAAFYYHFYLEFSYMILDGSGNWIYDPAQVSPLHEVIEEGITDTTGTFYPGLLVQGYKFETVKKLVPFMPAQRLNTYLTSIQKVFSGDFNGDGKADLVVWDMVNGSWTVYLSNINYAAPRNSSPNEFVLSGIWLTDWGAGVSIVPFVGDVNGDGKDDLIVYSPDTGTWRVALSNGNEFISQGIWLNNWARKTTQSDWRVMIGDFNGDGKCDILATDAISVQVALSTGAAFVAQWPWLFNQKSGIVFAGDFNGDGKDDIVIWDSAMGNWYVALSTGTSFIQELEPWLSNWALTSDIWKPLIGDVNGDGKDDLIVYSPSIGNWQFGLSSGSSFVASNMVFGPWGVITSGSAIVGDFNGDGKKDVGLQDISKGTFDISLSSLF